MRGVKIVRGSHFMKKNMTFIEELDQIVKEWLLIFKRPDSNKFSPNLIIGTDKPKYSEFVFLNMGSQLANQYEYKTLLLDLMPYTASFHSQLVDSSIDNINSDGELHPENIVDINKNLSLGLLYSDTDLLKVLASKQTQTFLSQTYNEYDVVLINAPQYNKKNKRICKFLISTISDNLVVVKENISLKRNVRELTSLILSQGGKMGNIYVK